MKTIQQCIAEMEDPTAIVVDTFSMDIEGLVDIDHSWQDKELSAAAVVDQFYRDLGLDDGWRAKADPCGMHEVRVYDAQCHKQLRKRLYADAAIVPYCEIELASISLGTCHILTTEDYGDKVWTVFAEHGNIVGALNADVDDPVQAAELDIAYHESLDNWDIEQCAYAPVQVFRLDGNKHPEQLRLFTGWGPLGAPVDRGDITEQEAEQFFECAEPLGGVYTTYVGSEEDNY